MNKFMVFKVFSPFCFYSPNINLFLFYMGLGAGNYSRNLWEYKGKHPMKLFSSNRCDLPNELIESFACFSKQ